MPRPYALIIPARNESESIGPLLHQIPEGLFAQVIVVDNGSADDTAERARAAGAEIVPEPRPGYGLACQAGLARLAPDITAVAFMDADLADDPRDLARLASALELRNLDLAIGSRVLGPAEPGALRPAQRFGNWLTTRLIRSIWGVSFTDLGPMRLIRRDALEGLGMRDRTFGWNVEMQAKAAARRLRVGEIPVAYRRRRFGRSKISGTLTGSIRAGLRILWTLYRCWRSPADASQVPQVPEY